MDNGLVFVVSTVQKIGKKIKSIRRRPRKTVLNHNHIDRIWGDKGKVLIRIPTCIDD